MEPSDDMNTVLQPMEGDRESLEQQFADEFDRLFELAATTAQHRGLDVDGARAVAQETMARSYASWAKVGPSGYLDAWVQRVAANVAVDVLRRNARAALRSKTDAARAAQHDHFEAALARLPRRQRDAVTMCLIEQVPEHQAAESMRCSVRALQTYAERGRARLVSELGELDLAAMRADATELRPRRAAREAAILEGCRIRSARRVARVSAAAVAAVCLFAVGLFARGGSTRDTPPAATTTTTATTTTVTTTTVTTTVPPSVATEVPVTAPGVADGPVGGADTDAARNPSRYFAVTAAPIEYQELAPGVRVVTRVHLTVTNIGGVVIDPSAFGDERCTLRATSFSGAYSGDAVFTGRCADELPLTPGQVRQGDIAYAATHDWHGYLAFFSPSSDGTRSRDRVYVRSEIHDRS